LRPRAPVSVLTLLGRPCAEPHPSFRAIIQAKKSTRCNRPACNQKINLGDRIACFGNGAWCHLSCAVNMKLEFAHVRDLEYLLTQVNKFARDELMADHMRQRLAVCRPSVYNGVPGSGKSAALVCMVKATCPSANEVYVYNSETAE